MDRGFCRELLSPHIPYFNELLTDRKMAYHLLADSNLDWGQGFTGCATISEEQPRRHA